MTAAAFATSGTAYPVLDGLLGISLVMHSHLGVGHVRTVLGTVRHSSLGPQFDALLVDYLHQRKFPILGPLTTWTLRAATVGVLVGVYQFNTNDIGGFSFAVRMPCVFQELSPALGLTELIAKVWTA